MGCENLGAHGCAAALTPRELPIFTNVYEIFMAWYQNCYEFFTLGIVRTRVGNIIVYRDVDDDYLGVIVFVWEFERGDERAFRNITGSTKMRRLRAGSLRRGLKTYSVLNKHTAEHMRRFLEKMQAYVA